MKNILYIVLFILPLTVFSQVGEIRANTEFSGRHCRGTHGLCNIDPEAKVSETNTSLVYNQDNTITLTINRDKITIAQEIEILGQTIASITSYEGLYFEMEDDFIIESNLQSELSIQGSPPTIASGNYLIVVTENELIINFNLQ